MAKSRTTYLVACRAERGTHYVLATIRRFYKYSEAELYTLSIDASRQPIVIMID